MGKKITVRVINDRIQFKCASCGAKRNFPAQRNIRNKNIRCHKCLTLTRCILNRRIARRELSGGKATMITSEGKNIEVNIHNISMNGGIGLEMPIRIARAQTVKTGEEVCFNCKWSPRLLGSGRFKIVNIAGQRIGIKKVL